MNENQKKVEDSYRQNWHNIWGKKKDKCECAYSKSMDQEYPRKCVKCGKTEEH